MEQVIQSASSDLPSKKLVRQLDFTSAYCGVPAVVAAVGTPPSHEQQHLQSLQKQMQAPSIPMSCPSISIPSKPEAPITRSRPLFEMKEGTPTRKKNCNCKHSRCLKLYCECFASGVYCDGCNCANCCNNVENEATRHEAVEATLERNPNAFRPKIGNSPHSIRDSRAGHVKTSGSASLASVPSGNAAISTPLGSAKATYRPLLADIVHTEDVKELCRILVVVSGEATKTAANIIIQEDKHLDMEEHAGSSLDLSNNDKNDSVTRSDLQNVSVDDRLSGSHADKMTEESGSDLADGQKGRRPMSPGTLALMCDEQDMLCMTSQSNNLPRRLPNDQRMTKVYADQEKCVLMAFRESLLKLINCGTAKEAKFSSTSLKAEASGHEDPATNGNCRTRASVISQVPQGAVNTFPASSSSNHNSHLPLLVRKQTLENGALKHKVEIIEM